MYVHTYCVLAAVFASCFYVLLKFYFMRGSPKGGRTYIHAYTHTHIHTYVYTYIHTYIHKYIHTYIHRIHAFLGSTARR